MEKISYGSTCKWADIEPGMLFSFLDGDKPCLAIKLIHPKMKFAYAVLTPGFAKGAGPALLQAETFIQRDLYRWEKSKAVIAVDPSALGFGNALAASVGDLLLVGDTLYLAIEEDGLARAIFNISTGELLEQVPKEYVTFSSWSVLLKADDGVKTIFQWPEGTAEDE